MQAMPVCWRHTTQKTGTFWREGEPACMRLKGLQADKKGAASHRGEAAPGCRTLGWVRMPHREGHRGRNGSSREKIDCRAPSPEPASEPIRCLHRSAFVSFDFVSPIGLRQVDSPRTRRSRLSRSMPVSPRRSAVRPSSISPARMVRPRVTVASMQGVTTPATCAKA